MDTSTSHPPLAEPSRPVSAAATETRPSGGDDLTRIRSIFPETQRRLNDLGVTKFRDIAAWTADDVTRISQTLGYLGRIEEENWVEQAKILERGGDPGTLSSKADREAQASQTVAAQAPVPPTGTDRLHRISGIDPDTEKLLVANGVTSFAQIAGWTASDIEKVESLLGRPGRVGLENWVGQAKILARGSNGGEASRAAPVMPKAEMKPVGGGEEPSDEPRSEIGALRSVRSAALRGDAIGVAAPVIGAVDDLKRIRGVGVLIEKKLNSLGVTTYEQIANWTGADIDRISEILDFKGRIERESWVEQARILASGGQTDFSRRADRGEVDSRRNSRA